MGERTTTRTAFTAAAARTLKGDGPVTKVAERQAIDTRKLHPLVDPAGYGVIRRSLPRLEKMPNGLFRLTVGTPLNIETRSDTTGSMGNNVDVIARVLPYLYDGCAEMAKRYDLQVATGVFNDVGDLFVLCRPQFEMEPEKIVQQLSLLVPLRGGGDSDEDGHYGLFGAAFLTDAHIVKLGLKGYDFTVTDAPSRDRFDVDTLVRVFGKEVFEKTAENGFPVSKKDLPSTKEVVQNLLQRAHAFVFQVEDHPETTRFWERTHGKERVILLPDSSLLCQTQAAIIGLTEGTLDLGTCEEFLLAHQVPAHHVKDLVRSLAKIPLGAQASLPNFGKIPKKDDLFETKTSLWPIDPADVQAPEEPEGGGKKKKKPGIDWK